jgi:hypothetical protein
MENDPVLNSDPTDFITSFQRQTTAAAIGGLEDDPAKAARAVQLSDATGIPAPVIHSDLENFEHQHKAALTADLLNNDNYLRQFIASDPMVPKIAGNDYAALDELSQKISSMSFLPSNVNKWLQSNTIQKGFLRGLGEQPFGEMLFPPNQTLGPENRLLEAEARAGAMAAEFVIRPINALIYGAAYGAAGEESGEQLASMITDPGLQATLQGLGPHGAVLAGLSSALGKFRPALPFLRNGKEPPHGALPEYDKFRTEQNAQDVEQLKDITDTAQKIPLTELAPEKLKDYINLHTTDSIGIDGNAVARLYGDKPPALDDGLLGWVPDIEAQLNAARASGDDVRVPFSDWVAYAKPELFDAIGDDIRMRPTGITANEAKLQAEADTAQPPPIPFGDPLSASRGAAALEPLLSVGDRKLELQRMVKAKTGRDIAENEGIDWNKLNSTEQRSYDNTAHDININDRWGPAQGFHDFNMLDEKGNTIGALNISEQKGGKQLYVDNITGVNGLGPRDFGPALMRDLLRQIKAEFPNAESISGHRVSGARERAGKEMSMPEASVKLDTTDTAWEKQVEAFGRALAGGEWEQFGHNINAYIKPKWELTPKQSEITRIVNEEAARIIPNKVSVQAVQGIQAHSIEGQQRGTIEPHGAYITTRESYPIILYSLDGPEPLGTMRHEAIHHLRNYGFFNKGEWGTLEKAAIDNDWLGRFDIGGRYPKLSHLLRLEEAIADAYKEWEGGAKAPTPEIHTIFEKLKALFESIRNRIGELLGKDPTWEDIFQKVSTGEVGSREGKPLDARAFDEKLSVPEDGGSRPYERANTFGMPVGQFRDYDRLTQKQFEADSAHALKQEMTQQARKQTKEWKDNRKALRQEVAESIKQRPDVAADLFFGAGELHGKKVPMTSVKMDASKLTPEQKAMLPRQYYGEHGLDPDDVAPMFGYPSGDVMVAQLGAYNVAKVMSKMSARDFVSRVIDTETDRQMQLQHGVLENNIIDAAQEHIASDVYQERVHQETLYYANKIGELPASRDNIRAKVREDFQGVPMAAIDTERLMNKIGQQGRAIEAAHRAEDWNTAFQLAQQREYNLTRVAEMKKVQAELGKFDTLAKRYAKRWDPTKPGSVDPSFQLMIRDILSKVQRPYGMSVQWLEESLADSGYKGLQDFVERTNREYGLEGIELPIADWLYDKGPGKAVPDLTVAEFRELNDSVASLHNFGRSIKQWDDQGRSADLTDLVGRLNETVQTKFPRVIDYGAEGKPSMIKRGVAWHTGLETLFARFDGRDPDGLFTRTFSYPAARAANAYNKLDRDFSAKYKAIGDIADPNKKMVSPIIDPKTGEPVRDFTRANMMTVVSNMGNDYNWRVFAKGWGYGEKQGPKSPQGLWDTVMRVAPPEMFDRAQKLGDVFNEAYELTRNVYGQLYGIAPEKISVRPVDLPDGRQLPGWYHPLIRDELRSPIREDDPNNPAYANFWPSTSNSYTKRRTGAIYTISLAQDMIPVKLNQVLHDVAFRQFVHETAKITRNKSFQAAVRDHYGAEYVETINHWLTKIAGNASYDSDTIGLMARWSSWMRQNVVASHIAYSATTIMKHGPTAAMFSTEEAGYKSFAKAWAETTPSAFADATLDLFGKSRDLGDSVTKFIEHESEEIERRTQNFQETISGSHLTATGSRFEAFRRKFIEIGSKGVAFSDRLSADPTWLAVYRDAIEETGDVARARDVADRAVRRAHGSTAVTNAPPVATNRGVLAPWLSTIYGFWGTRMQRLIELGHDTADAYHLGTSGEFTEAAKMFPTIARKTFVYMLWPMLVEEAVSAQFYEERKKGGLLSHALAYTFGTLGQSVIGIRDIFYALEHNREPAIGTLSTLLHDPVQLIRDAKKDRPLAKQNAGKFVHDALTTLGDFTGIGSAHIGSLAHYGIDLATGAQPKPRTAGEVFRGVVTGKQQKTRVD